ncbi:hypothetical protein AWE51_15150 [Aquimarina aggregata]|uniref:Lipoprotein n=1 Tax=Aquimarina aggregata TaxID=1642818 RepID=A0A162Y469_9FLAO|nr:hypothetical protein [Aquimarina aggregata]KZS38916.1 hypothetical protein AWE51_15150 [Aquimarina aggregata]
MKKIIIFLVISILSCNKEKNTINITSNQDVTSQIKNTNLFLDLDGFYQLKEKDNCGLSITIEGVKYKFKTIDREQTGTIEIIKEKKEVFLKFNGLFGDDPKEIIIAKYREDNSFIIQNYGNSMNPYTRFSECESKFLLIEKVNQ